MPESRWAKATGGTHGADYAARFEALAASGMDMHGEATLCAALAPPGSRVLDAGCGTGRVAIRLSELGYHCVGVDCDESMLNVARGASSGVEWLAADLAELGDLGTPFDLIVAAGNVIPLLAAGTEAAVIQALAARLEPTGVFVAGFGLDAAHLPIPEPPFTIHEYDAWCAAAGFQVVERFSTWSREPWDDRGYAVTVCRLSG
ncbi:MAG: methyltransferase domain-containing protein [Frankiaceae bacterium]|nr:methyltransferase domain-containing protein [Frankiaceae bacterium]MBV9871057.1 methyltransferase domain-containing protein [Frankiaceae bacterium]